MEKTLVPSGAILDTWSKHEWTDGIQIDQMQDLERFTAKTLNSTYEVTILSGHKGEVLVRGGKFFPEFTQARLSGSSLGGSFLKMHGVYVGFKMEFYTEELGRIITTRVQSIDVGTQIAEDNSVQ